MPVSRLNRRSFLKTVGAWFGKLVSFGLLLCIWPWTKGLAAEPNKKNTDPLNGLSLKQWCQAKHHHQGRGFANPFSPIERKNVWRLLRWKLAAKNHFKSFYPEETVSPVDIDWAPVEAHQGCAVTFITHACVLIKDVDRYLLVDPVLSGLFWFKDFSPLSDRSRRLPGPDHILITHGHYDHLDTNSLKRFDKNTQVISPLGYRGIIGNLGFGRHTQLDWYESFSEGGREIIFLPCNHWTMRNPLTGPNDALWGSYLIKGAGGVNIFISGDLAWFDHFPEIGKAGDIDLAVFNLGAYEPRWFMKESHINPAETVRAFQQLQAKKLLVVHWGTFRLGDEPVHFPPRDIRREMAAQGLADRLIHLDHGQTLFYPNMEIS